MNVFCKGTNMQLLNEVLRKSEEDGEEKYMEPMENKNV